MPIESGTTIEDLDGLWPLSSDPLLEGDNHLRLIKAVLKAQFPGVGGSGFAIPIAATEAEINHLAGVTSNIQQQIDDLSTDLAADYSANLYAPSGTVMVFFQIAPPVGWTQLAANNDSMLRVVSGSGGSTGGTDSATVLSWSHAHTTPDHTLTEAEMPSHTHYYPTRNVVGTNGSPVQNTFLIGKDLGPIVQSVSQPTGGGGAHNHGATGTATLDFAPRYIDVITAVKD